MSATVPPNTAAGFPSLAKKIWIFAIIRGVLGIIFGLIALFAPIATAVVLAIVIGVWAIVDGVFDIVEDRQAPPIIGLAIQRRAHRAGRALEQ